MPPQAGWFLLAAAAVLAIVGLLALTGGLGWFGRLPGDIRIEGDDGRVTFFAPIGSMLVVSVVLSLLLTLLRRIL